MAKTIKLTTDAIKVLKKIGKNDLIILTMPKGASADDADKAMEGVEGMCERKGFGLIVLPAGWESFRYARVKAPRK